jgi:hypothetical protein
MADAPAAAAKKDPAHAKRPTVDLCMAKAQAADAVEIAELGKEPLHRGAKITVSADVADVVLAMRDPWGLPYVDVAPPEPDPED